MQILLHEYTETKFSIEFTHYLKPQSSWIRCIINLQHLQTSKEYSSYFLEYFPKNLSINPKVVCLTLFCKCKQVYNIPFESKKGATRNDLLPKSCINTSYTCAFLMQLQTSPGIAKQFHRIFPSSSELT